MTIGSGTPRLRNGAKTDDIAELTAATGVTIDGLRVQDSTIKPVAGGSAFIDLSACATGEGDIILADNLAIALQVREAANPYLSFVTTNSAEAIASSKRLYTSDGVASGTNRVVGGLAYVSTAASTAITGTTETEALFDTQYSLPADSLKAGTVLKIRAVGAYTATTGTETHSLILKIGSVAITTIAAIDPANSNLFYFDCILVCRTAGVSGTIVACGTQMGAGASGTGTTTVFGLASTAIDTTAANIVGVAIDRQGTATDSDSCLLNLLSVEVIG